MTNSHRRRARLLAVALAFLAGNGADDAAADVPYTLDRLTSRVLVLDCLDVHVTAIATDSGLVVIDTGRSVAAMRQLRGVIAAEFGRADFRYLINTHGDPDHRGGNAALPTVPLVAHAGYAAYVLHSKAAMLRSQLAGGSGADPAGGPEVESPPRIPAIVFTDSLRLDLGDLTLELRYCGEAHTNHDIVVYVPEEKLLLSGDLICSPRHPCFRIDALADVPRLVRVLDDLARRSAGLEQIVPGHGRRLERADLATYCRTLSEAYRHLDPATSAAWVLRESIASEGLAAALRRCPPPGSPGATKLDWSEAELATLGARLTHQGRIPEARGVLQLAVRVLPGSALLWNRLGDAALEAGDRPAALAAYRESLALVPGNTHAAELAKVLGTSRE